MAMTKKEQERMNTLTNERDQYKSLLFVVLGIVEVERDVEIPTTSGVVSQGWDFNAHTKSVYQAWSKDYSHGTGVYSNENNRRGSQDGLRLFSTKEKVKQALSNEAKLRFASELLQVGKL